MSWATTALRLADACIKAVGNAVTIGETSGRGVLNSPSESIYDGVVVITDWNVELPVNTWPMVAEGTVLTIDGQSYVAREQGRISKDGGSIMVPLELAPAPPPAPDPEPDPDPEPEEDD